MIGPRTSQFTSQILVAKACRHAEYANKQTPQLYRLRLSAHRVPVTPELLHSNAPLTNEVSNASSLLHPAHLRCLLEI